MEKGAAEREALGHAAREGADPLVSSVPEAEALEEHSDALTALRNAVEPSVELQILERGQLAVDERLVRQIADLATVHLHVQLSGRWRKQTRTQGEESRLSRAVPAGDEQKAASRDFEIEAAQNALGSEIAAQTTGGNQISTSARTKAKKVMLMTPFMVKKAMSRRRRSVAETRECS